MWAVHVAAARYWRMPLGYGLLFPVGYVLGAALALHGAVRRLRGQVQWKGRVYALQRASGGVNMRP
jgi:chlorobactene glucosyltransferase